ncbi:hypothetical protein JR316_0003145 [Psilocybe cubensis]|uniref:RING-type domain-containing protein n=2 Tax=Psilocybe cubensis TaxID=181762 RepID=A0A8H7Y263_PSICU|nr:hypothetical protein JR316_0003145 [Psilocybe cubensis]KAH9483675.1 hypothetical protein JR316_0003145 [Psilocybe cubensis]
MSNVAPSNGDVPDQPEFDFWEFVCCAKCRMPFTLENGAATIPFWLTECGHVVCNNHLNRDQSCAQCGAQDIQLAPLQRQMEAPMSDWFRSIPSALESIAFTAKFQNEAMASQVRYHKSRHLQLRQIVERLKQNMAELKRSNDMLQNQNEQLRRQMGYHDQGSSNSLNGNGKRPMVPMQQYDHVNQRARTDSSPRSITTPLAPDRLTLPPGQQVPELSSHRQQDIQHRHSGLLANVHGRQDYVQQDSASERRPMSSRSLENIRPHRPTSSIPIDQFAYNPQGSSTFHTPQLTHVQAAPKIFQRTDNRQNGQHGPDATSNHQPPSSSRFKPAPFPMSITRTSTNRQQTVMGPPPTPQHVRSGVAPQASTAGQPLASADRRPTGSITSSMPGQQQPPLTATRRFFPEGVNNPSAFSGPALTSSSRGPSRASVNGSFSNAGQKMAFGSGAGHRGGFG